MSFDFDHCLAAIAERSAALRSAAADASDAPDLHAPVPGCPDWTLADLIAHVGGVQLFWAAVVRKGEVPDPRPDTTPRGDLLEWSEASTQTLIEALREVGPERPCWTWWEPSGAPQTAGAVARHQVQEAAVHAWDAMETTESPTPLPSEIAVDAIDEFLVVSLGSEGAWPHPPARLTLTVDEGRSWTVDLTESGAAVTPAAAGDATTSVHGTASDLLLAFFGRVPPSTVRIEGDATVFDRVLEWADTE